MHGEGYGYCECGVCGQKTELYKHSDKRTGAVKGEPRKYVWGHGRRLQGPQYEEVDLGYVTPCWIWRGTKNKGNYARTIGNQYAHIVYYEREHGPVPEDLELDHLCHTHTTCAGGRTCPHRPCVRPDHLEAVPPDENHRRQHSHGPQPKR